MEGRIPKRPSDFGRKNPTDYSNLPNGKNSPPIFLRNTSKTRSYISNIKNTSVYLKSQDIPVKISSLTGRYPLSIVRLSFGAGYKQFSSGTDLDIKHIDTFSTGGKKEGNYGIQLDCKAVPNSSSLAASLTKIDLTEMKIPLGY